MNLNQNLELK